MGGEVVNIDAELTFIGRGIREIWGEIEGIERDRSELLVERFLDIGERLNNAKERHGRVWCRMFADHEDPLPEALPFTRRTAHMLMKVANHPQISNGNHGSHFPPSWRTLYELTRVPDPKLLEAIDSGDVSPTMTREDAKALKPKKEKPKTTKKAVMSMFDRAMKKVESLSVEDRSDVLKMARELISDELKKLREVAA